MPEQTESGAWYSEVTKAFITDKSKKVLSRIGDALILTIPNIKKHFDTQKFIAKLYRNATSIRTIKTLWHGDIRVDLNSFFVPPHITIKKINAEGDVSLERVPVSDLSSLYFESESDHGKHFLIQGIAGQGKSVLVRYFCSRELYRSDRLIIFIEFRFVQRQESLLNAIAQEVKRLGLDLDAEACMQLLRNDQMGLFLDGFDEVAEEFRPKILSELAELARQAPKSRIIASSRPNYGADTLTEFNVATISNLKKGEYLPIVDKLLESDQRNQLENEITHSEVKDLLITPILVTLLCIHYKAKNYVPANIADFYGRLFESLFLLHDLHKAEKFLRKTKCGNLNIIDYERLFHAFCFQTKLENPQVFNRSIFISCIDEAKQAMSGNYPELSTVRSSDYLQDIRDISCLVVSDKVEFRFIHKSIQEYHTAQYLALIPEDDLSELSKWIFEENLSVMFSEDFSFLASIAPYRFKKYIMLPILEMFEQKLLSVEQNFDGNFISLSSSHLPNEKKSNEIIRSFLNHIHQLKLPHFVESLSGTLDFIFDNVNRDDNTLNLVFMMDSRGFVAAQVGEEEFNVLRDCLRSSRDDRDNSDAGIYDKIRAVSFVHLTAEEVAKPIISRILAERSVIESSLNSHLTLRDRLRIRNRVASGG